MEHQDPVSLTTVSSDFLRDWLLALGTRCSGSELTALLHRAGIETGAPQATRRVTLSEIARLYQFAASATQDEMMGLWSRPIRPRALQHLVTVLREAGSLSSALYRFSTFWNLLLDDFHLQTHIKPDHAQITLKPYDPGTAPQRFGHMLLMKLAHGMLSWLAGSELPVKEVRFAFAKPDFARDYAVVFPARVRFDAAHTAIAFDPQSFGQPVKRSAAEASIFLQRAPLDWIFTGSRAHLQSLRVRAFLYNADWQTCQLPDAAAALAMTPRTLIRRLRAEGTSFQQIKDALRRDIAIRALQQSPQSIEEIAHDTGFSAPANFHRAFRRWTGRTPGSYRLGPRP